MIPRRLRLRNFLSYRDCTVDFSGVKLAVLCGRNGDGKSALLDAMTWALWGEARGRIEDDRIFLGENEMLVDFEFEAGGDIYNVTRKRTRGRGAGELHFFQVTELGRSALTGGTIAETQAEITKRVRMGYETFANSAFVAQGRSNEFTSKPARERKEVFRKILGLELYELLSDAARTRQREAAARLKLLEKRVAEAESALAEIPTVEAELVALAVRRTESEPVLAAAEEQLATLRQLQSEFERLANEARAAHQRVLTLTARLEADERAITDLDRELTAAAAVLAEAPAVRARHDLLTAARTEEGKLAEAQLAAQRVERAATEAETAIAREQARLQTMAEGLFAEVAALREACAGLATAEEEERELRAAAAQLATITTKIEELQAFAQAATNARAAADADVKQIKTANDQIIEKKRRIHELTGQAECPVCRQPLRPDDIEHVLAEYASQQMELRDQHRAARQRVAEAEAEAARLGAQLGELQERSRREDAALRGRERDIHGRLAQARAAAEALPAKESAHAAATASLEGGSFAPEAREALRRARLELAAIAYDGALHRQLREQIAALGDVEAAYRQVITAQERQTQLGAQREQRLTSLAGHRVELAEAAAGEEQARAAVAASADSGPALRDAEDTVTRLRAELQELARWQGAAEQKLAHLREVEAQTEADRDDAKASKDEEATYADLWKAFGRDGVQALLIEQSLPRVEAVANEMLDHMTGGRIAVQLVTQKTTAGQQVRETLDIRIADDVGTRSYEMYSGGEAFRVDFALRIGLAKLLAERAGAELPTLIIDEGFGSQDADGIDRLVEAITAVSNDFRLILVVTHVEALRDRFERRIEVTKDPTRGSQARVV